MKIFIFFILGYIQNVPGGTDTISGGDFRAKIRKKQTVWKYIVFDLWPLKDITLIFPHNCPD